jgi:hypothetical protein
MKGSGKTTAAARETIRALTLARMPQKSIMAQTGLCRATVWAVQKELKLPQRPWHPPPLPRKIENKIVKLLKKGWGRRHIAQHLGIGEAAVKRIMGKIRHRKPRGAANCRYNFSAPECRAIRKALFDSETRIAQKFGVSRVWLSGFRLRKFSGRRKATRSGMRS